MTSLSLFLPLAKVDLDQRIVTGVATAETPDRSGEICDYASSKPFFEKWSAEAVAASGGKSLGAVRAMHGRVAAGKLTDIAFDDDLKRIVVAAKIVDDDEWLKVCEGVYTGFSQGGRYVKRWPDPETNLTRYTAEPHEISLVDLPCLPDATFEVVKDGVVEKRAFAPRADLATLTAGATEPDGEAGTDARAWRESSEAFYKAAHDLADAAIRLERAEQREPAPHEGAERGFAGARRSHATHRAARSPAAAREGRAARGREKRRRRGRGFRRRRGCPAPRGAAPRGARAGPDQAQPDQPAPLLSGPRQERNANSRIAGRRGVRRRGGRSVCGPSPRSRRRSVQPLDAPAAARASPLSP